MHRTARTRPSLGTPGSAAETEARHAAVSVMRRQPVRIQERSPGTETAAPIVDPLAGSTGKPLPAAVRASMEPMFGYSFSDVRVHADSQAAGAARQLGARAFACGTDLGFASGAYDPQRPAGRALLAHELAHVVQSRGQADVVMRDTGELSDEDLLKLAEASPVQVRDRGIREFDEVLLAARNGLIHITDPPEFERQLRFRSNRMGDRSWENSWTADERMELQLADDPDEYRRAKWERFVRDLYFAYLREKASQWRQATRRMSNAANIGKVIGGITIAGTALIGGAAAATAAGGTSGLGTSLQLAAGRGTQAYLKKPLLALGASVAYGVVTPPGAPDLPGPGDDFGRALRGGGQAAVRGADAVTDTAQMTGQTSRSVQTANRTTVANPTTTVARAGQVAGQAIDAAPPATAVSAFSGLFDKLLRRPFNLSGAELHVEGVGFGGVNALVRDGELVVTYSHIINAGRVPGQGRLMHSAFEQAAAEFARSRGLTSVRVAVSSVQNPNWASHLASLGYHKEEFEIAPRQFVFWFARKMGR